jgi:hypothetical protein
MTNNKQQTAVDSIIELCQELLANHYSISHDGVCSEIIRFCQEQAKEMEKEQQEKLSASWAKSREQTRETAMRIGFAKGFISGIDHYEDYYSKLDLTDAWEDDFQRNYITDRFEETQGGEQ